MGNQDKEQTAQEYSERHEDVLTLTAGELTEDLIRFVTGELDDEVLDDVDVHRVLARQDDLASEPITIAVVLGLSTATVVAVGRIIERWIEKKRQRENIELTIEAFKLGPKAGQLIGNLARSHAEVSVSYSLSSVLPVTGLTELGDGAQ